jgi:ribose/xylose/arabinose/galactoside ABC-type transport system permease subunit
MSQLTTQTESTAAARRYSAVPRLWTRLLWPALGLLLLIGLDLLIIPHFGKVTFANGRFAGTLVEIFRWSGPLITLAIGMTLVIATGGIDLSVGAVMALAGAVMGEFIANQWSPLAAIAAAVGVSLLAGLWNGILVTVLDIQPIVATLVLMVAGRGLAQRIGGSAHLEVPGAIFDRIGGATVTVPTEGLIGLLVFAITLLFVRVSNAGLLVEATGGNRVASRFAGVPVKRVVLMSYVFCSFCAGLAGLLVTADNHGVDPSQTGIYWELDAILAVVLGGTSLTGGRFSLTGTVLGSVLIWTLTTSILSKVAPAWALIAKAVVVIAVCLLQSEAFRRKVLRK